MRQRTLAQQQELNSFLELKRDELRKQEKEMDALRQESRDLEAQNQMRKDILSQQVSLIEQQQVRLAPRVRLQPVHFPFSFFDPFLLSFPLGSVAKEREEKLADFLPFFLLLLCAHACAGRVLETVECGDG